MSPWLEPDMSAKPSAVETLLMAIEVHGLAAIGGKTNAAALRGLFKRDKAGFSQVLAVLIEKGMSREDVMAVVETNNDIDQETVDRENAATIVELAALSEIAYQKRRSEAAAQLDIGVTVLDKIVKKARASLGTDTKGQGRPIEIPVIEPWPEQVNGAVMLDEVVSLVKRYMILPDGGPEMTALWATHTHCFDLFGITPRLAVTSPVKGCGKTTLLDLLEHLVARALLSANVSSASIFRVMEMHRTTLLMDEADTFLTRNDEMRGLLNAGYRRDGKVMRLVGEDHEPREFSVFAPVAIAMIGRLPDTLEDRSVAVSLRRKKANERTTIFRHDRCGDLNTVARKMARWTADHSKALATADPNMGSLFNRVADNWRPLFAIADLAGGEWPKRCREAAKAAQAIHDDQSIRIQLLADLRELLGPDDVGLTSDAILAHLLRNPEKPWLDWKNGKPITAKAVANFLKSFQVFPGKLQIPGDDRRRGYPRQALIDAFECYLPPSQCGHVSENAAAVGDRTHCNVSGASPDRTHCEVSESAAAVGDRTHGHIETPEGGENAKKHVPDAANLPRAETNGDDKVESWRHAPVVQASRPMAPRDRQLANEWLKTHAPLATPEGTCVQCNLDDGKAYPVMVGKHRVTLHRECKRFFLQARHDAARRAVGASGNGSVH